MGQHITYLYSTEDGWNGQLQDGTPSSEGVYYFIIEAIDYHYNPKKLTGSITLVR
jgi:hypothetical protein